MRTDIVWVFLERGHQNQHRAANVGPSRLETFIARTACDSREMRAKFVQKHFRDLRVSSPQNCVKIVRAQLLHNFCAKNGAHAQFLHNFSEHSGTQAGSVLRTMSAQVSLPGAILLKSAAVQDRDVSNPDET